jgi:hypothetical protein
MLERIMREDQPSGPAPLRVFRLPHNDVWQLPFTRYCAETFNPVRAPIIKRSHKGCLALSLPLSSLRRWDVGISFVW